MALPFHDRADAGRQLAAKLSHYQEVPGVIVLGLPRGGVPVAFEVASSLHAPLDVFIVRKLGAPGQEELAIGAVASGGVTVLNEDVIRGMRISQTEVQAIAARELQEVDRRERVYRDDRPAPVVRDKIVILVDDGLATGASMLAAADAIRERDPKRIVIAVPVAPRDACADIASKADEVVCVYTPRPFRALSQWYENFSQTSDDEVKALLGSAP